MAFLSNDGDITIDCVLTDTGRARLAKGDGSFKIVKFSLGDQEIDYSLYNKNHPSGSAYYDLDILMTPILEAFTNNGSAGNSNLISIQRTNLLYLPVIKQNGTYEKSCALNVSGAFFVAVDKDTEDEFSVVNNQRVDGVLLGETVNGGAYIRLDQGLDTSEITPAVAIDSDLVETQYIVEIDNRLGKIASKVNGSTARVSYIDDDNVASYYFSLGSDTDYVLENTVRDSTSTQVIAGPRGTILQFTIQSSLELNTSTFLFDQLGNSTTMTGNTGAQTVRVLDSYIRVTGATTGCQINVPIRFLKLV